MFDGKLILPIELRHGPLTASRRRVCGLVYLGVAMRKSEHVFPRYGALRTAGMKLSNNSFKARKIN
jgi:hypothetical protein